MPNPLVIAVKGKGFFPLLARGQAIVKRYGLTSANMNRSLARLADTLDEFQCAATLPFTAMALARHQAIAQRYQARGLELGVHGLVHVDYTQLTPDEQRIHLCRTRQIFEQAGLCVTGFRCPYLRWNADTLIALNECGFAYDSSQALAWDFMESLETGAYRRVLAFYGAQAAADYPALPRLVGNLVRIPYCLPDDEALVERLHLTDSSAIAEIWIEMLERIHAAGELFTVGLHPERVSLCQVALRAVLAKARSLSPAIWIARLDEIATWWHALRQAAFQVSQEADDLFRVTVHAPSRAAILVRSVEVETLTQPWARGYQCISAHEFTVRCKRRPFIGLSPDSSPALHDFLRQQGYLVEVSAEAHAFPVYFQRAGFGPEDERPLLAELNTGYWPSVRLARWPGGAQSALAITGDIDAVTLWDYGLRAVER